MVKAAFIHSSDPETETYTISISLINSTFEKMHISKNELMSNLPYQQAILLIAIHNVIFKTESLYVLLKDLYPELKWIYQNLQITFNMQMLEDRLKDL